MSLSDRLRRRISPSVSLQTVLAYTHFFISSQATASLDKPKPFIQLNSLLKTAANEKDTIQNPRKFCIVSFCTCQSAVSLDIQDILMTAKLRFSVFFIIEFSS